MTATGVLIVLGVIVLIALFGMFLQSRDEKADRKARDRAVLEDFRNWSAGRVEGSEPSKKTDFAALGDREQELRVPSPALGSSGDPVCQSCRTTYDRQEVIRLIKQQSPEIFEFQAWTTKFVCKVCRTEIVLSGSRGE